jgi:pentatricopeptide repeat protein
MIHGFIEINDIEKCIKLIKELKEKNIKLLDIKLLNNLNIKISN